MSKPKFNSKRRRYRSPKNTLGENCRIILTPNGDRGLQACFKRHVKAGSITDKTK
jgi:hypothetical protein